MEIEVKVKIEDIEEVKKKLMEMGVVFSEPKQQIDDYYKQKGKETETQRQGSYIIRIRSENGKFFLTMKILTGKQGVWEEFETKISDKEQMEKMLDKMGYVVVISKVKERTQGKFNDFEINLDKIEGLGNFVEFELITDDSKKAKERILSLIEKLGLPKENIIHKGYVRLLFEKMGVKYEDN